LPQVRPVLIAGYIEQLQLTHSAPTVKQHLAAVRMLFDWLVVGQRSLCRGWQRLFEPGSSVRCCRMCLR
jgi:hypothetical protein